MKRSLLADAVYYSFVFTSFSTRREKGDLGKEKKFAELQKLR